jgi:hypothetical protein
VSIDFWLNILFSRNSGQKFRAKKIKMVKVERLKKESEKKTAEASMASKTGILEKVIGTIYCAQAFAS